CERRRSRYTRHPGSESDREFQRSEASHERLAWRCGDRDGAGRRHHAGACQASRPRQGRLPDLNGRIVFRLHPSWHRFNWLSGETAMRATLLTILLAGSLPAFAHAGATDVVKIFGRDPGAGAAHACFIRHYTKAHLASHPQQNVTDMLLYVNKQEGGDPY